MLITTIGFFSLSFYHSFPIVFYDIKLQPSLRIIYVITNKRTKRADIDNHLRTQTKYSYVFPYVFRLSPSILNNPMSGRLLLKFNISILLNLEHINKQTFLLAAFL